MNGTIFNIEHYAIHDGPGIRTTVFFKGCPLACLWCHNPEGLSVKPQIVYYRQRCVGCKKCVSLCTAGALSPSDGGISFDAGKCRLCGRCAESCPAEALEKVGLKDRAHHLPGQLSGGEQQRVCVARALINDPKLILADEPTGNLDEKNEKIVLDLFRKLHEQGTTIIVVTHDALVASCAQREIMLNHGVLVGEKWNDEDARKAYEAAGGKPASTGAQVEGAQNGETAIGFADPTKAAKTGGEE